MDVMLNPNLSFRALPPDYLLFPVVWLQLMDRALAFFYGSTDKD